MPDPAPAVLVLGIGNVLMGDEGVGVEVVRYLARQAPPPGAAWLDGGTGGFHLLGPVQEAGHVVLVDATVDGAATGSVRRLVPRHSGDYPPTLTAHDIGLKDLLDALQLLGDPPATTLFAISIELPDGPIEGLSPGLAARVPAIAGEVRAEVERRLAAEAA